MNRRTQEPSSWNQLQKNEGGRKVKKSGLTDASSLDRQHTAHVAAGACNHFIQMRDDESKKCIVDAA